MAKTKQISKTGLFQSQPEWSITTQVQESGIYMLRTYVSEGNPEDIVDAPFKGSGYSPMGWAQLLFFATRWGSYGAPAGFQLISYSGRLWYRQYQYGAEGGWIEIQLKG